jgi:hypothetical protein
VTDPPEHAESPEPVAPVRPGEGPAATGPGSASASTPASAADSSPDSADPPRESAGRRAQRQRKQVLLRLDPAMHDAIARWAADELRSTNAQIDYLLRKALADAGRLPRDARPHPRRGRPAARED